MIVQAIVVLVLLGLVWWAAEQFPLPPLILRLIRVVAVVGAVLYLLRVFGLMERLP